MERRPPKGVLMNIPAVGECPVSPCSQGWETSPGGTRPGWFWCPQNLLASVCLPRAARAKRARCPERGSPLAAGDRAVLRFCGKAEGMHSRAFSWVYFAVVAPMAHGLGQGSYVVVCPVWMMTYFSETVVCCNYGISRVLREILERLFWVVWISSTHSFTVVRQKCFFSVLLTTSKNIPYGKWNLGVRTAQNKMLKLIIKVVQGFSTTLRFLGVRNGDGFGFCAVFGCLPLSLPRWLCVAKRAGAGFCFGF